MAGYSLLVTDANGDILDHVPGSKGKGRCICMIGAISRYEHIITHYPPGHETAGQPVIDCDWLDASNKHVESNGSFIELKKEEHPRRIYGRMKANIKGLIVLDKVDLHES